MGKASRSKQLKRIEAESLKKYGNIKLSEALLRICEPYKIYGITRTQYEHLITLGASAWNMANLSESDRRDQFLKLAQRVLKQEDLSERELIQLLGQKLPDDASDDLIMLTILSGMIGFKLELFPHDDRIVKDFWFERHGQSDKLQVESIIPGSPGQAGHAAGRLLA